MLKDIQEFLQHSDIDFNIDFQQNYFQIFEALCFIYDIKKEILTEEDLCLKYNLKCYLKTELEKKYLIHNNIKKVNSLKELVLPDQRTPEWYEMRKNKLTASSFADALGKGHFKGRNESLHDKIIDKPFEPNPITEWGVKYEEVATRFYEFLTGTKIYEFGLIPHSEFPAFGASPDGICDIDSPPEYIGRMLEIKCPPKRKFTKSVPKHYWMQMQGQLEVCDLEYCDFLECEIKVYDSKEAFIEDSLVTKNDDGTETIDYRKTKAGNEKGAIFEIQNSQTKGYTYKYNYESLDSLDTINEWEDPLFDLVIDSEHLEHAGTTFWYLNKMSTVLVQRDRKWFTENFYKIRDFWTRVEHARIHGIPERKKKETKIDITQFTGTALKSKPFETVADFNS